MSVFQGIKGKFQGVQQDIVDGLKALTSFESHPRSEILKRLRGDGVKLDAGADLLYSYHLHWKEIDTYSKESAKKAETVDKNINKIFNKWKNQGEIMKHLEESIQGLPALLQILSDLTSSLGALQEDFQQIEDALEKLEDVCEEQDMAKQRLLHIHQLQQYKQTKLKDREKVKVEMAKNHAKRIQKIETNRSVRLQDRHEAFDDAFTSDMSYYIEHGKTDTLKLPEISKVSSLSDITIEVDDKALNDFLATPIAECNPVEDSEIHDGEEGTFIEDDYTIDYGNERNGICDDIDQLHGSEDELPKNTFENTISNTDKSPVVIDKQTSNIDINNTGVTSTNITDDTNTGVTSTNITDDTNTGVTSTNITDDTNTGVTSTNITDDTDQLNLTEDQTDVSQASNDASQASNDVSQASNDASQEPK